MKFSLILLAGLLSGCAGLHTQWRVQVDMQYSTPDKDAPLPAPVVKP
jgi:hypothetical protein